MGKFWIGFIIGTVAIAAAAYSYIHFGYVDPRADVAPGALESAVAMPALDAAVDRRAPKTKNPVSPSTENLVLGMQVYQANCALCHGDPLHPKSPLAGALSPRAPQFLMTAPDMSDDENFYIIQHGVRWSGMPAWSGILTKRQMWQATAFLSRMNDLPADVSQQWKEAAAKAAGSTSPPAGPLNPPQNTAH